MKQLDQEAVDGVAGGKTIVDFGCGLAATGAAFGLAAAMTGIGAFAAGLSALGGALVCIGNQTPGGGDVVADSVSWDYCFGA